MHEHHTRCIASYRQDISGSPLPWRERGAWDASLTRLAPRSAQVFTRSVRASLARRESPDPAVRLTEVSAACTTLPQLVLSLEQKQRPQRLGVRRQVLRQRSKRLELSTQLRYSIQLGFFRGKLNNVQLEAVPGFDDPAE